MSLFENSPRKWPNSHSQKLFLSIFEKWQNSILSICSAITGGGGGGGGGGGDWVPSVGHHVD